MVVESEPKPEIKHEQEAIQPDLPDNPEALEHEKRNVIRANVVYISALVAIFVLVVIYFSVS